MTIPQLLSLTLGLLPPGPAAAAQDPDDEAEVSACDTVEGLLESIEELGVLADELRGPLGLVAAGTIAGDLVEAGEALDAGLWPAALPPFCRAFREVHLARFLERTKDLADVELEVFDSAWRAEEAELEGLAPRNALAGDRAAILAACEDVARLRAWRYYKGSRAYARPAGVAAGRHYLGRARASAELAAVLRGLPGPAATGRLEPEPSALLERLEADLADLFRPPLSRSAHGEFIELSAALEFARELRRAGSHTGALLEALEVDQALERFRGAGESFGLAEVEARLEELDAQVLDAQGDLSIVVAFLHRASRDLGAAAEGSPTALADARALVGRVIADGIACANAVALQRAEAEVTVTLVRWPFT